MWIDIDLPQLVLSVVAEGPVWFTLASRFPILFDTITNIVELILPRPEYVYIYIYMYPLTLHDGRCRCLGLFNRSEECASF